MISKASSGAKEAKARITGAIQQSTKKPQKKSPLHNNIYKYLPHISKVK